MRARLLRPAVRLRGGARLPAPAATRVVAGLDELTVGIWGGDDATMQLVVAPLAADRRFAPARREAVFTAVLRTIPLYASWLDMMDPITDVAVMGGLHNTLRRLVVDGQPVILGLHAVGDAVCTTNPTFGRGLSTTLHGAADLVDVLAAHPDDPCAQALAMDRAGLGEHVAPWFADQAVSDAARLAMLRHTVLGAPPPAGSGPGARDVRADPPGRPGRPRRVPGGVAADGHDRPAFGRLPTTPTWSPGSAQHSWRGFRHPCSGRSAARLRGRARGLIAPACVRNRVSWGPRWGGSPDESRSTPLLRFPVFTTPEHEEQTMTTTMDSTADRALKAKHRAMWALGDYPAVAIEVIPRARTCTGRRDRDRAGRPSARRRRRLRQRRHPGRADRRRASSPAT